ncbi:MAG: diaminopimelate epimerase, partial [Kiritimatiellaceae bacterium]|nr:diaminopimelate epimerase [Kiritimatiellaceae bacterium]
KLKFWKMHGARNDFVLFDDREGVFPVADAEFIRHVASRRAGIGAEGVILIQSSETADFLMRFFNPDGGEVGMCGNGARCAARLAYEMGAVSERMSIETRAGTLSAQVLDREVCLWMTEPVDWELEGALELTGISLMYGFVNTGVPHVVLRTDDLANVNVKEVGTSVRYHRTFLPNGTNVNFMKISPEGELYVRTYERGVEAETLACGTGVTACGLIAAKRGWVNLPVRVHVASGDVLMVDGTLTDDGACDVTLTGPSEFVFEGSIEYEGNCYGY